MQAVGLTPGGCASWPSGYPEFQVAQALKMTGAEDVRWNLSDLFASPDDPKIEAALARDLERAKAFEATYKGKVATLEPKPFAAMMRELADYEESSTRAEVYAYMLHSENTQDNAAGRLLARVREASAERGSHMVFFALELAQITDEHAAKLYADPESAVYRHTVDEARKFRPHQLSEPEERVLTDFSPVGSSSWVRLFEEPFARIRLNVGDLHEWDRYAPVSDTTRDLTWDDAKELVLGSYYRFSKRAGSQVEEFFKNSWIDAPVVPGKAGGAYCMPVTPRHHPYVLLNFTGKLRDALVLAHELGHGLHDRLASKQHIFDYHPPLTLAETASVFGEALTFDRIMAEEKDAKVRLALLCGQCEDAFSTVFRQVAFNRYEDASHNRRRTEGELSVEELGEMFQEKLQPMFGDALILTEEHKVWWSYVGHFLHTPGYVYAYAFGNLLALSVYHRYLERGQACVDDYLEFLAAGGSTRPDELVKKIGMDITDPASWDAGLNIPAA